jgi:hypothetical protein
MSKSWLLSLFSGLRSRARAAQTEPPTPRFSSTTSNAVVQNIYPPDDQGLPVFAVDALVAGNESLIERVRLHASTSEANFQERYLAPIGKLASLVNSLPGSSSSLFSGEGGLLRAALELAFLSLQASDGRIFTASATVEVRHKMEPRWRYVCFLGGLLYPIGLPLVRMVVSSQKGESWPRHKHGVTEWALASGIDRFYINWPDEYQLDSSKLLGPSPYTASVLHKVVGADNLEWLDHGSPDLTRSLFELVGGGETNAKIAQDVIQTMWAKVKQREESRRPQSYGRLTVGTHLTPYLVGAMRSLVADGTWIPNEGPLIVDMTGVYLVWPAAGDHIVRQGGREGRDGWPSSSAILAELLKRDGVFDCSHGNDFGMIEIVGKGGELHSAYKIAKPANLIESFDPSAYQLAAPKTLEGVLQRDPLTKATVTPGSAVTVKTHAPQPVEAKQVTPPARRSIDPETGEITDDGFDEEEGPPSEQSDLFEEGAQSTPVAPAPIVHSPAQPPALVVSPPTVQKDGKIKEATEVKFSDLVPEDVRKDLKSVLNSELLGKVIKAWRERGEHSSSMRMTDNGAAVSMDFLGTLIRSIPDWVSDCAEAGLIYTPADRPGLKIQKVAFPEGSKVKDAVVISRYGCKKLGL